MVTNMHPDIHLARRSNKDKTPPDRPHETRNHEVISKTSVLETPGPIGSCRESWKKQGLGLRGSGGPFSTIIQKTVNATSSVHIFLSIFHWLIKT